LQVIATSHQLLHHAASMILKLSSYSEFGRLTVAGIWAAGREVLFSDFLSEEDTRYAIANGRPEIVVSIVDDFERAFPDLIFEMRLDRRVINAQAIALAGKKSVLLYGGIALHPHLGPDALTFCLLHEVGHHLANGNRLPCNASLACECASDYWASTTGADLLREISGRNFEMEKAMDELAHVIEQRQASRNWQECWGQCFCLRRKALINPPKSQPSGECFM
jgi:hypothetical protein